MKNLFLSVLFLLGFGLTAFSQDGSVKLSPEYKLAKSKVLAGHLHSNSTGHYILFKEVKGLFGGKTSLILEKYDRKFKEVFSQKFETNKKNIYSVNVKYFKNKFAWLLYEKNKSDDYLKFFLTPIDLKGKSAKPKAIAKFKYKKSKDFPNIDWKISSDTSKILFIAESDNDSKKEKYEAYLAVLDTDFNTLWEKRVKLPYTEKRVDTKSWEISNDGKVYVVTKVYEDNKAKESKRKKKGKKKGKRNKTPAYDMIIYSINGDEDKPGKYELQLQDAFVKGVKLKIDETSDDLACVGFFGDSRKGPSQGVFYLKLSAADGSSKFASKRRFTPKELDAFGDKNTSKDKKSKDSGLDLSFKFDDISILKNGEIVAIAEESYFYTRTYTDSKGNSYQRTVFVSNSIVVITIGADGEVNKVGIIPKKQKMESTILQSYATLKTDDDIYFVYNDDKDNIRKNITDPDKIKRISSGKDCVAVMTKLDEKGKMNRKQLFTKKEAKSLLMPVLSKQISKTELLFFNTRPRMIGKSKFRFGILEIK